MATFIEKMPNYIAVFVDGDTEPILIARLTGSPTLDVPWDTKEEVDRIVNFVSNAYAIHPEDIRYKFVEFDTKQPDDVLGYLGERFKRIQSRLDSLESSSFEYRLTKAEESALMGVVEYVSFMRTRMKWTEDWKGVSLEEKKKLDDKAVEMGYDLEKMSVVDWALVAAKITEEGWRT
jgi:hypothetical protein